MLPTRVWPLPNSSGIVVPPTVISSSTCEVEELKRTCRLTSAEKPVGSIFAVPEKTPATPSGRSSRPP